MLSIEFPFSSGSEGSGNRSETIQEVYVYICCRFINRKINLETNDKKLYIVADNEKEILTVETFFRNNFPEPTNRGNASFYQILCLIRAQIKLCLGLFAIIKKVCYSLESHMKIRIHSL